MAAIAAPAGVLALFLIFQSYASERASVAPKLLSTARALCAVVDGEIDEGNAILKGLAGTGAVRRSDFAGLEADARRALADDDRWFVLVDTKGKELVNTRLPQGAPLGQIELGEEFTTAAQKTDRYVSNLSKNEQGELVVSLSRPYVSEGKVQYYFYLGMAPPGLGRALEIGRYAPGNIVAVVDRHGQIVARSRSPEKYVGASATPDVVKAVVESAEGMIDSVTLEHLPVLTAYSRARCGWSVLIGAPKSELYKATKRLLILGLICSALLTLAAVFFAQWIARALLRSVDAVTREAEVMGGGRMPEIRSSGLEEMDFVMAAMRGTAETLLRRTDTLAALNELNAELIGHREIENILKGVTDAARKVSRAAYASIYYNAADSGSPSWVHSISGLPSKAFKEPGAADASPVYDYVLRDLGTVLTADITADSRYNKMTPPFGLPKDHPPVRSYLAVPIKIQKSEGAGGLFLSHPEAGVFTEEVEKVIGGIAAEAAIAIENAKLYEALKRELEAKSKTEAELRIAQVRLQEHAEELEQKIEERTASLREAITQMEEFSYTVSHDLRSPVRAMHGYASLLIEDYGPALDETARDYLQRIQRANQRMDQLTTDVLSYSRVARSEVQLVNTNVDAIVRSTLEHYDELQPDVADISIELPLHPVLAHEPALRQCIANLLTNAVKFVKPGEKPQVLVRSEKKAERVRLWIEDQGVGILPKYQANLFRTFERVPTHGAYRGTGVGLAIVRKAAEKMGGNCGVESDGKNGSRFWVELTAA